MNQCAKKWVNGGAGVFGDPFQREEEEQELPFCVLHVSGVCVCVCVYQTTSESVTE